MAMRKSLKGFVLTLALFGASIAAQAEEAANNAAGKIYGTEATFGVQSLGNGRCHIHRGGVSINASDDEWKLVIAPLDSVEVVDGKIFVSCSFGRFETKDSLMLKTPKGQIMYHFSYCSNQGANGIMSGWEVGRIRSEHMEFFHEHNADKELPDYSSLLASAPSKAHAFGTTPAAPETVNYGFRVVDGKKLSEAELEAQRKAAEAKGYKPTTRKLVIK